MRRALALLLGILVLIPSPAGAHSGSYDMKYVDGSNLILLTFNTHQPASGLEIVHNLRLYDLVGAPILYDEVTIDIHGRGATEQLALPGTTVIHSETVPMLVTNESKLDYTYVLPGQYTVETTFYAEDRKISHGKFAVEVAKGAGGATIGYGPWTVAGAFIMGVAVATLLGRLRGRGRGLGRGSGSEDRSSAGDSESWPTTDDPSPRTASSLVTE